MTQGIEKWRQVHMALNLLSFDPSFLKGIVLRIRLGPVHEKLSKEIKQLAGKATKLHPNMSDEQLYGGIDVVSTIKSEGLKKTTGLLNRGGWFILGMAERCTSEMAARLSQALDLNQISPLVIIDEGIDDEAAPEALSDRLAFSFDLSDLSISDTQKKVPKLRFSPKKTDIVVDPENLESIVALAVQFGIESLRAPQLALHVARIHALSEGRPKVNMKDIEFAALMVYPSRAKKYPEKPKEEESEQQIEQKNQDESKSQIDTIQLPDELLIEAVQAKLPENFLEQIRSGKSRKIASSTGFGSKRLSKNRGRPKPARKGQIDGHNRIDLLATLRTAAPFQTIRKPLKNLGHGVCIFPTDIHLKRYESRSERVVIFTVDASGSAALARLAETKGAVELMLSQAYARRDFVALIGFRETTAEVLLPPTRSLVQTKRRLASLPGGGGTPIALGLKAAAEMAVKNMVKGKTPIIALLTDGRANITLEGVPDRIKATEQTQEIGRWIYSLGIKTILMDTGIRPNPTLKKLGEEMNSLYFFLPRANSNIISHTINSELNN